MIGRGKEREQMSRRYLARPWLLLGVALLVGVLLAGVAMAQTSKPHAHEQGDSQQEPRPRKVPSTHLLSFLSSPDHLGRFVLSLGAASIEAAPNEPACIGRLSASLCAPPSPALGSPTENRSRGMISGVPPIV